MLIRWEPVTYSKVAVTFDLPGIGRYYIGRREKGSRQFVIKVNGKETGLFSDRADAIAAAETEINKFLVDHAD